MSVHTRTLVTAGARTVLSPLGSVLFVTFVLALAVVNAAANTVLTALAGTPLPTGGEVAEYGVVLPINPLLAVVVGLAALVVGAFAVVVGTRLFIGQSTSRWSSPLECLTHRIVPVTVAVLVSGALVGLAVGAGTLLLVIPGVVIAGHLLLVPSILAAEDVGLATAFAESWQRAAGARVELATVGVVLLAPAVVVIVGAGFSYLLPPMVEFVLGVLVGAALLSLWLGVAAEAYQRLAGSSRPRAQTSRTGRATRAL